MWYFKANGGGTILFRSFDMLYNPIDDVQTGTMESLNMVEDYIDYAIHSTIKKQIGDSNQNEKEWVGILFNKFLDGDTNVFTSNDNIRSNILGMGTKGFYLVLMKNAIEYTAYRHVVMRQTINQSREDFVCSLITDKLSHNEYIDTLKLIKSRDEYKDILINVYTNFKYGKEGKDKLVRIVKGEYDTNAKRAIECLEFNLEYGSKGDIARK